ncbi:MAG: DUF5056 domain-containing protein [Prevotella sp.]|nr:DUF5056 domain-containing protein [Prevotella sp.]
MTDKDNLLLEGFFKQAARQQIEDNGFTERVMTALDEPMKVNRKYAMYIHMWTLFCIAVAALLFFLFSGMDMIKASLHSLLHTAVTWLSVFVRVAPTTEIHIDPLVVILMAGFVLIFLPYQIARTLYAEL